jgi:hypothetical protein
MKNDLIESLMVIGYDPSHSTASLEVNAPLKILSTLIRCLNCEILAEVNKKTAIDDLNFDEYIDQEDINGGNNDMNNLNDNIDINEDNTNTKEDQKADNEKLEVDMGAFEKLEKEEQEEIQNSKLQFLVIHSS